MTAVSIIGLLGGFLTLVALLTTGYVILRSTLSRTTSELWKQEADALRTRLVTVEMLEADCKMRLTAVESANRVLSDQVSGTSAVALLAARIEKNQADLVALLGARRQSDA